MQGERRVGLESGNYESSSHPCIKTWYIITIGALCLAGIKEKQWVPSSISAPKLPKTGQGNTSAYAAAKWSGVMLDARMGGRIAAFLASGINAIIVANAGRRCMKTG